MPKRSPASWLTRRLGGFDVQAVINQPSHLMARTVEEFFADRRLDDRLLFYFTGTA